MYIKIFFVPICFIFVSCLLGTFNVFGKCTKDYEEQFIVEDKNENAVINEAKFTEQVNNNIKKWNELYYAVQVGTTTRGQIFERFKGLSLSESSYPYPLSSEVVATYIFVWKDHEYVYRYSFFINPANSIVKEKFKRFERLPIQKESPFWMRLFPGRAVGAC